MLGSNLSFGGLTDKSTTAKKPNEEQMKTSAEGFSAVKFSTKNNFVGGNVNFGGKSEAEQDKKNIIIPVTLPACSSGANKETPEKAINPSETPIKPSETPIKPSETPVTLPVFNFSAKKETSGKNETTKSSGISSTLPTFSFGINPEKAEKIRSAGIFGSVTKTTVDTTSEKTPLFGQPSNSNIEEKTNGKKKVKKKV